MSRPSLPLRFGGGRYTEWPPAPPFTLQVGDLLAPLDGVARVGPATSGRLSSLGLTSVGDLLQHYPRRYDDYSERRCLADLRLGEEATVRVVIEALAALPTRRRNLQVVRATVRDQSGKLEAVWFNQAYLAKVLEPGVTVSLRGVLKSRAGRPTLVVKSHEILGQEDGAPLHTEGVVPIYPASEQVSARLLRAMVHRVLPIARRMPDPLPLETRLQAELPARCDALVALHAPRSLAEGEAARARFVFEELYLLQVGLLLHKAREQSRTRGYALGGAPSASTDYLTRLPFDLTAYQVSAIDEIKQDLQSEIPMRRLLQGDVGSGKTVVAVYALLRAVECGKQGVLMAPTETLAVQHLATVRSLVGPSVNCELLVSGLSVVERRNVLKRLLEGDVDIVVGTHALLQETVAFKQLAVVVVDEQHRFGVIQRDELVRRASRDGRAPHVLYMTATPIPRTLALTLYGDLDVTVIAGAPAGRSPVVTRVVSEARRERGYQLARKQLDLGRQVYVVCPTIDESESLAAAAAVAEARRLRTSDFAQYRVGVLHGQMKAAERQTTMAAFQHRQIDVLVATSVIEVGIDVSNATVMIIEGADRFGLAQLHQLRGRVGRGTDDSFCLLFARVQSGKARARLRALVSSSDGFALADLDLQIRGEGQLLGARQAGLPDLKLARLDHDRETVVQAREAARRTLLDDPTLEEPKNAPLVDAVQTAFGKELAWLLRA